MLNLLFIGTGGWVSTPFRSYQCLFIDNGKCILVLDCGAFDQAKYTIYKNYLDRIKCIIITHIHGDHVYGLPSLLFYMKFLKITGNILLLTPSEYIKYLRGLIKPVISEAPYNLRVKGVNDGDTVKIGNFNIDFVKVDHTILSLGCKIKVNNVSIGYTSDTRFCSSLDEIAEGSDLLICEASFPSNMKDKAREVGHLTPSEGINLATDHNVNTLIFTHIGFDISIEKNMLRRSADSPVIWASDNMVITV